MLPAAFLPFRFPARRFINWLIEDPRLYEDPGYAQSILGFNLPRPGKMTPPPSVFTDEDLRNINVPTFLLIGEHGRIMNRQKALDRANATIPDITIGVIQGAGHVLIGERPETVTRKIMDFLTSN